MTRTSEGNDLPNQDEHPVRRVHLPGFIINEEIGFGDVIKQATAYIGIKPCGGCEKRAAILNRWLVFTNRPQQ